MKGTGKKALLISAVVALLLVGVGTALAAGGPRGGFDGGQPFGMHHGGGPGVMAGGVMMDAAAEYIGITEDELMTARHDGKSLAQIATDHGKTAVGLESALVTAFQANLDKAVAAGRLTAAQAAQALSSFKAHVTEMVQRTVTGPMAGRGGGMMGAGGGSCGGWS